MSSHEGQRLGAALLEDEANFIDHSKSSAFIVEEIEFWTAEKSVRIARQNTDYEHMNSSKAVLFGRIFRGSLAALTLTANGGFAFLALIFACCGGGGIADNARSPFFWGSSCAAFVCLASIPRLSSWLRTRRIRWALIPLVIASVAFVREVLVGPYIVDWLVTLLLVSTSICTLYVTVRVIPGAKRSRV